MGNEKQIDFFKADEPKPTKSQKLKIWLSSSITYNWFARINIRVCFFTFIFLAIAKEIDFAPQSLRNLIEVIFLISFLSLASLIFCKKDRK